MRPVVRRDGQAANADTERTTLASTRADGRLKSTFGQRFEQPVRDVGTYPCACRSPDT